MHKCNEMINVLKNKLGKYFIYIVTFLTMDIIKNFKRNKTAFMASILRRLSFMFKDDELYLKLLYLFEMHKKLDLNNPTTFNEKLQWLKLYNRRPEYTRMVDKYEAKK